MEPDSRQSLIKPLLNVFWSAPLFKLLNLISMPFLLPFDPCIFIHMLYTINIVYTSHSHLNLKVVIFLNILTLIHFWQCLFTFCANARFYYDTVINGSVIFSMLIDVEFRKLDCRLFNKRHTSMDTCADIFSKYFEVYPLLIPRMNKIHHLKVMWFWNLRKG